jgi:hypothetical protein
MGIVDGNLDTFIRPNQEQLPKLCDSGAAL